MKNENEKEVDEALALAEGIVSYLVPGVGDVLAVGSVILADDRNTTRSNRFTKNSFDTSLMGLSLMLQRNDFRFPATLRVFDIQEMAVFGGKVSFKGAETILPNNGEKVSTHRYSLETGNGEPIDVWLRTVGNGLPHFVQLTGKEGSASFKVRMRP